MFHEFKYRAFVAKTLCIAVAITSVIAAARALLADKPVLVRRKPIINGMVIDGVTTAPLQVERTRLPLSKVGPNRVVQVDLNDFAATESPKIAATTIIRVPAKVVSVPITQVEPEPLATDPSALEAGLSETTVNQAGPEASAYGSDETDVSEPEPVVNDPAALGAALAETTVNQTGPDASAYGSDEIDVLPTLTEPTNINWWRSHVFQSILEKERNVSFDLETILIDTLQSSPRIQIVSRQTSIAIETIVQQDAAFDSSVLFETGYGRVNDPVGSTLTTGGPPRLIDDTFDAKAGIRQTTRRGTTFDLSQQLGLKDSNSNFFSPTNQGNSRLSLNLTQPLLDRSGRIYNERLVTQARIDSRISWQEMRTEVEQRIAEVMSAYWQLYELRCHLIQQTDLLNRALRIESILNARQQFDAGRIELAKARQRVARRQDRLVQLEAEVRKQQTRLASLVGTDVLFDATGGLELIPNESPNCIPIDMDLRTAVQRGLQNRPEIRAATKQLESAALTIRVTRTELEPQLNAVLDAYLAGLTGGYDVLESFGNQFTAGGPGIAAGLEYELPRGRRAAKSRVRQAQHRFRQRTEELRETIQMTQAQIENAVTSVGVSLALQTTKQRLLDAAIDEEAILTRRWELMAGDGGNVGTVLENVLDAQQRRTEAEREWTSAQTQYLIALVDLQRSMGTLMVRSGIEPLQEPGTSKIRFGHPSDGLFPPGEEAPPHFNTEPFAHDEMGINDETR